MSNDATNAIITTINLYALAVDTQQWDLFDDVFTPDAVVDFGGGTRWTDLSTLTTAFAKIHTPYLATCHTTTNHVVTATAEHAHCLSYVHGRFFADQPEGSIFESGGWYDDRLTCTPQGWRISHRTCRTIWSAGNPKVMGLDAEPAPPRATNSLHRAAANNKLAILSALRGGGQGSTPPHESPQ
ncbi:nuclear transport factor 2 family protein [Mycobacterium sp. E2497]|uniref:nuclear transport factor 2 family protein n=1 Tax=Mycobacterium sp. E2497 TaxID=1834135 RepID=UPI000ADFDDAB|nr:nuclear transport factor 2 family protein [Mycobacterium sp. E2497]